PQPTGAAAPTTPPAPPAAPEPEPTFAAPLPHEEAAAITGLTPLGPAFLEAVTPIDQRAPSGGRVSVTGLGHSGLTRPKNPAARILREEAAAIPGLTPLEPAFFEAVTLIEQCARSGGSVLVTGLGKSGLIGAKIAATFSSLGIPAHSVHPTEAVHGDLGRFRPCDTVLALSFSGETDEVVNLAAILRQDGLPIISITGGRGPEVRSQRSEVRSQESG